MKCMVRPQSGRSNSTVCRVIWNTELLSLGGQAVHKQQRERQIRQHGRLVLHHRSDGAPGEGIYSRLYNSGWIHTSVRQPDCKIQDYHELSVRFSRQFRDIHERLQGEFSTWCWNGGLILLIVVLSCSSQSVQNWSTRNIWACYWRQHKGCGKIRQIHCRERSPLYHIDGYTAIEQICRRWAASHFSRLDPISEQCSWAISRLWGQTKGASMAYHAAFHEGQRRDHRRAGQTNAVWNGSIAFRVS